MLRESNLADALAFPVKPGLDFSFRYSKYYAILSRNFQICMLSSTQKEIACGVVEFLALLKSSFSCNSLILCGS
jgi:hypothetical protein